MKRIAITTATILLICISHAQIDLRYNIGLINNHNGGGVFDSGGIDAKNSVIALNIGYRF